MSNVKNPCSSCVLSLARVEAGHFFVKNYISESYSPAEWLCKLVCGCTLAKKKYNTMCLRAYVRAWACAVYCCIIIVCVRARTHTHRRAQVWFIAAESIAVCFIAIFIVHCYALFLLFAFNYCLLQHNSLNSPPGVFIQMSYPLVLCCLRNALHGAISIISTKDIL